MERPRNEPGRVRSNALRLCNPKTPDGRRLQLEPGAAPRLPKPRRRKLGHPHPPRNQDLSPNLRLRRTQRASSTTQSVIWACLKIDIKKAAGNVFQQLL